MKGTQIGLNIENGTGKHSIIQVPLQYGKNEDGTLKYGNIATGSDAIALGISSEATNSRAVAIGNGAKAGGNTSFVIGQVNTAEETASGTFIGGNGNVAYIPYSLVFGTKNQLKLSEGFSVTDCSANLISGDINTLYDADTSSIHGYGNLSGRLSELDTGIKASNHILGAHNISYGTSVYTVGNYNKASGWYLDQVGHDNFAVSASNNYFYNPSRSDKTKPFIADFAKDENGNYLSTSDNVPLYYTHQFGNNLIVGRWHTTQIGEYNHTNKYNAIEFGVNVSPNLDAPGDNPIRSTPLSITRQGKALYGVPYQTYCELGEDVFEKDITIPDFDQYELANHGYVDNKDAATLSSAKSYTNTQINELDVDEIKGSVGKTITKISETDGKISATMEDIQIDKWQVNSLITDINDLQLSISNKATEIYNYISSNVEAAIVPISYNSETGVLKIG